MEILYLKVLKGENNITNLTEDPIPYRSSLTGSITDAYAELVTSRISQGWTACLVTFTFKRIPGPTASVRNRMLAGVSGFYSKILTRIVRRPRSSCSIDYLPLLIGSLDVPVHKQTKTSLRNWTVNGGLHAHAVLVIPPLSRLTGSVEVHIDRNAAIYRGREIDRLDVRLIADAADHERVLRYVLKAPLNGRLDTDESLIILPRARSEL